MDTFYKTVVSSFKGGDVTEAGKMTLSLFDVVLLHTDTFIE
jgi:hypothetical protein